MSESATITIVIPVGFVLALVAFFLWTRYRR